MMDTNDHDQPRRKSFFTDELDEHKDDLISPQRPSSFSDRERMTSRYDEEEDDDDYDHENLPPKKSIADFFNFGGNGFNTRHLIYAAGLVGGVLVLFVGSWMIYHSSNRGIPIYAPSSIAAKEKPANTANVDTIGIGGVGVNSDSNLGQPTLAPGPEQANLQALAQQYQNNSSAAPSIPDHNNTNSPVATSAEPQSNPPNTEEKVASPGPALNSSNNSEVVRSPAEENKNDEEETIETKQVEKKHKKQNLSTKKPSDVKTIQNGKFEVQLAALGSEQAAEKQWKIFSKKATNLLSRYNHIIKHAEINGRSVYRLRLRGFSSRSQAGQFCKELNAQSVSCTIANF